MEKERPPSMDEDNLLGFPAERFGEVENINATGAFFAVLVGAVPKVGLADGGG